MRVCDSCWSNCAGSSTPQQKPQEVPADRKLAKSAAPMLVVHNTSKVDLRPAKAAEMAQALTLCKRALVVGCGRTCRWSGPWLVTAQTSWRGFKARSQKRTKNCADAQHKNQKLKCEKTT